jgi:hypothetical protein
VSLVRARMAKAIELSYMAQDLVGSGTRVAVARLSLSPVPRGE